MAHYKAFAAAGLIPGVLVAAELKAYYDRRARLLSERRSPQFVEGSMEWLIERKVSTLDLVLMRRSPLALGPCRGLAAYAAQCGGGEEAPYDSVGIIVVDREGRASVIEADTDGSVRSRAFSAAARDSEAVEIVVCPLAWPQADRDRVEEKARLIAYAAVLRCGVDPNTPLPPWTACVDERLAPLYVPRGSWPAATADAPLAEKLRHAVSPAAALVLEMYCGVGLIPPQHRATAALPSDFAPNAAPPFRKGARFAEPITIKCANA